MTRDQLHQVRDAFDGMAVCPCQEPECADCAQYRAALAILDAELAKPEEREWRGWWGEPAPMGFQVTEPGTDREQAVVDMTQWCEDNPSFAKLVKLESRTPAGPWEPEMEDVLAEKLTTVDENLKP